MARPLMAHAGRLMAVTLCGIAALPAVEVEIDRPPTADEMAQDGGTGNDLLNGRAPDAGKRTADEFIVVPCPGYNPTVGGMLTVLGLYAYHPTADSAKPWTLAAVAMGAQNGTWGVGVVNLALPRNDTWRVLTLAGYVDARYDYFGSGSDSPLADDPVELRQRIALGMVSVVRRTVGDLYLGPSVMYRGIETTAGSGGFGDLELEQGILGLGARAEYDTRDSQYFPTSGIFSKIRFEFDGANGGSFGPLIREDLHYQRMDGDLSGYHALRPGTVLAGRLANNWVSDDAPFYDQPFLGRGPDLRGYFGQYRDRVMLAAQGELRQDLPHHFGVVGFAGVGQVAPSYADLRDADLHPSLGAGLRYTVAEENHMNVRFDAAWGDDGWTWYLSAGEAF